MAYTIRRKVAGGNGRLHCNHFRMPYWQQIDPLMDCIQRLSYLLSQGYHNCDVAILYPTEPVIAEMDGAKSVEIAFETGKQLYNKGIDFDFIDFDLHKTKTWFNVRMQRMCPWLFQENIFPILRYLTTSNNVHTLCTG